MHKENVNRVVYYSNISTTYYPSKGEHILRAAIKPSYTDINEVLELYKLKKYIDNEVYLNSWSEDDIINVKKKIKEYNTVIQEFFRTIDANNIESLYKDLIQNYIHSFWEIINNQRKFDKIPKTTFSTILKNEPHLINEILTHKKIVDHYGTEIRKFLLTYPKSAEILLGIYGKIKYNRERFIPQKFIPQKLSPEDTEKIIETYLNSNDTHPDYINLISDSKKIGEFNIPDETRLKAKRLYKTEIAKIFPETDYKEKTISIKLSQITDSIKQDLNPYSLFKKPEFRLSYTDNQGRISLVSKKSELTSTELISGLYTQHTYSKSVIFYTKEEYSHILIYSYTIALKKFNTSLEEILGSVFNSVFHKKYNFPSNARFSVPTKGITYLEKITLLAPKFELVLKQFNLFVKKGSIDFDLLGMSSKPLPIKSIPSLNKDKYLYINDKNKEITRCSNCFFSECNPAILAYVKPFENDRYNTFFDLLTNEENHVYFDNYAEFQKTKLKYLIDKGFINVDSNGTIQITNIERLCILKDLYDNEVASFYHYPFNFQEEAKRMKSENMISFENSLFSRPEQAYFNYYLNKSEFINGLDIRNRYVHGTQAPPDQIEIHKNNYFIYLKLLYLVMLKIDDDLHISKVIKDNTPK